MPLVDIPLIRGAFTTDQMQAMKVADATAPRNPRAAQPRNRTIKTTVIAAALAAMTSGSATASASYLSYGRHAMPDFTAVNAYEESIASRAKATADWGDGQMPGTFRVEDGALVRTERSHGHP